jgi:hypothetical protein
MRSTHWFPLLLSAAAHGALLLTIGDRAGNGRTGSSITAATTIVALQKEIDLAAVQPVASPIVQEIARELQPVPEPREPIPELQASGSREPALIAMESHYFSLQELAEKPQVVQDLPVDLHLPLPEASPHAAMLELLINESGAVDHVIMADAELDADARQSLAGIFSKIRFRPGKKDGVPVKCRMRIEVVLTSTAQGEELLPN